MTHWRQNSDPFLAPDLGRSALLVVDTQVDFVDGGTAPIPGTSAVLPAIARLVDAYREASAPIVHVVRLYEGDDVDLCRRRVLAAGLDIARPGTAGSQVAQGLGVPPLDPESLLGGGLQPVSPTEHILFKPRWSSFYRTELDDRLRQWRVDTVVIAGCNYPHCPRATIFDASERDYKVLVAADAISGVDARHLEEAGRIGVLHAETDEIVEALQPPELDVIS
ncbi:isochorismatase [Rhodococcus opacus PD630]|uniref:cysteine hydrolase family protein n=1 Tax=Rhodococcus opacus TaxID=37919 RepID=UPI00029CD57F|nr:isochorismatase family cysteine hydrolase [Rhodococcus opacus]AHK33443.1 putative isochorismatase family protein yddQ [Rhodococcus opacus PD630]EHI40621.1 isochorismatase [Rhodococcus opacus PD630]UDG95716.1 cysteine hydrolase [Rhodococcus opacus PD630]